MKKLLLALLLLPSLLFGQATGKVFLNKPSGFSIPLDSIQGTSSVSLLNFYQTTSGQTITIPNMTVGAKTIYISNIGSASFTLSPGGTLPIGKMAVCRWTGAWSVSLITPTSEVSNADYNAISWNGVTTIAPSKNAVRDEFENKVSKLTGDVLFDFQNSTTLNVTTDNGAFTRSSIHLSDEEMNFGYGNNLFVAGGSNMLFSTTVGHVIVPTGNNDTLALLSDITGTNSGTNTGDETTARINTLYGYTPANPSTVSAKLDTSLASGKILIGQSYGGAAAKTPSGDVTIDNAGVTTIGALKVTNGMLFGGIGYSKLSLTGSILNADLAGSIAYSKLSLTGSILNADLAGSITDAKLNSSYLYTDGTRALTGDWAAGGFNFTGVKSLSISGTGGNGFINLINQTSAPSTPASGVSIYHATAGLSWVNSSGFTRSLTMPSANVVYTFPSTTETLAGLGTAQTFSAAQTFSSTLLATGGSATVPGYGFTGSSNYGLGLNSNQLQFIINGVSKVQVSNTTIGIASAMNLGFATSGTGTKIGDSNTNKFAFWNATPITQPANTVAIDDVLVNTGLQASGASVAKFTNPVKLPSYTVATVPSASTAGAGAMIYVSDETGGAVIAFSDGTNWRRVTDRAVIS